MGIRGYTWDRNWNELLGMGEKGIEKDIVAYL